MSGYANLLPSATGWRFRQTVVRSVSNPPPTRAHPIADKTHSPTRGEIPIAAPRAEGYRQRGVGSIRIDPVDVRIAFIDDAPDARILNCLAP